MGMSIILEQQIQRCLIFTSLLHGKDGGALVHRKIFKNSSGGRIGHPLGVEKNLPGIGSYPLNAHLGTW